MHQSVDKSAKLLRLNDVRVRRNSLPPYSGSQTESKTKHSSPSDLISPNRNVLPIISPTDPRFVFLIEFAAGAMGGVVSRTLTAPIDRLRTIFQVDSVEINKKDLNAQKVFYQMIEEGKWKSLWRGNLVNILKTAPESAIRFATYEKLKALINQNRMLKVNSIEEKLACGSAAGFIATLALYPLKTVKTMMNLGKTGEYTSIADCMCQIYRNHGVQGFYRGLLCNSVAIIPSAGIDLACYETMKQYYSKWTSKSEPNVTEKILIGIASSSIGNFVVYPLLFARTRLQSNRNQSETTMRLLREIWRRDGLRGIYRGFSLHMLKIGPAAGISYITFESVTKMFSIDSLK